MPYEQLIESVEVSAEEKIRDLHEKAKQVAMEIIKEAATRDGSIKKRHLDAIKKTVETERYKSLAKTNEETRMQLTRVKDDVFKNAFTEAQKTILLAREQPGYENNFREMLKEAVIELEGEELQLHIDIRDESPCNKLLTDLTLNCRIITDITSAGGLNANTKDGRFVVFNTIESRFERAKVLLKPEIFTILYGGQGGV